MNRPTAASNPPPGERAPAPGRPPLLESEQLLQGHRAVEIHHNGELYRLQATRTGKLILTK
jgi:hemin uptake protein HemP